MNNKEFTEKYYVNRKNSNCLKWDEGLAEYHDDEIVPVFVADMDFRCPESVVEGLRSLVDFGDFGYAHIDDEYYDEWIKWNKDHHNVEYKKEWVRFSLGAVSGIYHTINAFTKEGDAVMIMLPSYPPFKGSVLKTNRKLVETSLIDHNGHFEMDFEDIENKVAKENVKMIVLCSPHNPIGRVWTKEELTRLLDIAMKYDVLVLSDEVHQDLLMPGFKHSPILSMDEKYHSHLIELNACAKTFNLAQLSHSHVLIADEKLRAIYYEYTGYHHIGSAKYLNAMGSYFAYKGGAKWLEGVLGVVYENYLYVKEKLTPYNIEVTDLEGTYLVFVNLENVLKGRDVHDFAIKTCKFLPNFGDTFGEDYASWVRLNLATSKENIEKVVNSIINNI